MAVQIGADAILRQRILHDLRENGTRTVGHQEDSVGEVDYLADRIFLMTNGPGAVLAEIVENPLPQDRIRTDLHRHPHYYALRNHVVDFLVSRSRSFASETPGHDPRNVAVVRIGKPDLMIASSDEGPRQALWPGLSRPSTSC